MMLVNMRAGSGIPNFHRWGNEKRWGEVKESLEGVRCGGDGGWGTVSSGGVRDSFEAEGELDKAGVGHGE
jgi:hypothetical protein